MAISGGSRARRNSNSRATSESWASAGVTMTSRTRLRWSQITCSFLPLIIVPPSHPRVALLTVSDTLTDWESTITEAVCHVLPAARRMRWRRWSRMTPRTPSAAHLLANP
jgi:hypothetical protein